MAPSFIAVNCSNCVSGYVYNYSSGGCAACPSNCVSCTCGGSMYICTQTYCESCLTGFVLNGSTCEYDSASSTFFQENQIPSIDARDNNEAIIGVSIWGTLMTVLVVGFGLLYLKRVKPGTLSGDSPQAREVML